MDSYSRREDRWVGRGRRRVLKGDFVIEAVWKTEVVSVFGCGRGRRCALFGESVTGSGVMAAHLQHLSVLPKPV